MAEGNGNFTGITLLNPDPNATALLALEVYAPEGTLEGRYLGELCGRCKKARVLLEWVPVVAHRWGDGFGSARTVFFSVSSCSGTATTWPRRLSKQLFGNLKPRPVDVFLGTTHVLPRSTGLLPA